MVLSHRALPCFVTSLFPDAQRNAAGAAGGGEPNIGRKIVGVEDDRVWGVVTQDSGNAWMLEGGRVAKKKEEDIKWKWQQGRHPSSLF